MEPAVVEQKVGMTIRRWRWPAGVVVAVVMFCAFALAYRNVVDAAGHWLTYVEMTLGGVAGWYVCRMLAYSWLGGILGKLGGIRIDPSHPDGAGGLRPIGEFYLRQAVVAAIPAAFLGTWVLLINATGWYVRWRGPYIGLLVVAIFLEIAAFVLPMMWFHREMRAKKNDLLRSADELSKEIAVTRGRLAKRLDAETRSQLQNELEGKVSRYESIESLPTWPLSRGARRVFAANNVVLTIPLAYDVIRGAKGWQDLLSEIGSWL